MRVYLFLILGFENEDNLDGHKIVGVVRLRKYQLWCRIDGELGSVLDE